MVMSISNSFVTTVTLSIFLNYFCGAVAREQHEFTQHQVIKKEKLTHFRVYFHDVVSGPAPTAVFVVKPPTTAKTTNSLFGSIAVIDDSLTMGPEMNSTLVGRAQGLYGIASQSELSLLMAMNFVFVAGKYKDSTISILGRNTVMSAVREMPIIGGSGLFRFARGYVQARTHSFDSKAAVVEYNVYVMHY